MYLALLVLVWLDSLAFGKLGCLEVLGLLLGDVMSLLLFLDELGRDGTDFDDDPALDGPALEKPALSSSSLGEEASTEMFLTVLDEEASSKWARFRFLSTRLRSYMLLPLESLTNHRIGKQRLELQMRYLLRPDRTCFSYFSAAL